MKMLLAFFVIVVFCIMTVYVYMCIYDMLIWMARCRMSCFILSYIEYLHARAAAAATYVLAACMMVNDDDDKKARSFFLLLSNMVLPLYLLSSFMM